MQNGPGFDRGRLAESLADAPRFKAGWARAPAPEAA
jgi:hypothetical protein